MTPRHRYSASLICLLLCISLLMGMAACTGQNTPEDTTTAEESTTWPQEEITDTESVESDAKTEFESELETESKTEAETAEDTTTAAASTEDTTAPESEIVTEPPFHPEDTPQERLPYIYIDTESGEPILSKEEYVRATISVGGCDERYVLDDCSANIRVRGNTTGARPKKPYRIKFDTKQGMLGLNDGRKYKNWCLLADYYDLSMLRTWSAFSFADVLLEDKYYSSDCTQVEVFLNDEYMGVYLLCEQTQINPGRVDIDEKRDGEASVEIGYLMIGQGGRTNEPDTVSIYPSFWVTDRNGERMYFDQLNVALSGSDYNDAQKTYVKNYVTTVIKVIYQALYNERYYGIDPNGNIYHLPPALLAGKTTAEKQIYTIDAVFDIEAAVRMCVLEELVKNQDIATFNLYIDLSPNGDKRLTLAAPWDYDFAMGNNNRAFLHDFEGRHATAINNNHSNLFYVMLGSTDWFDDMCSQLWQEKYPELRNVVKEGMIRTYRYTEAYNRDWERWGAANRPELEAFQNFDDMATFENHTDAGWFLYTWLTSRMRFIDRIWGDGTDKGPAPARPCLKLDLADQDSLSYLDGFKRCSYTVTFDGLLLTLPGEARDPYFYVDYTTLLDTYLAEEYYILEIEYMIPTTNSLDSYAMEIYLCTGDIVGATSGVSVVENIGDPDGEYHTLRIDLSECAYWEGKIHKIRLDYFDTCAAGDRMYIKSVKLLPN